MARLVKIYKNLDKFTDRHGKVRYYFRVGKMARTPILGQFGSHDFDENYEAATKRATSVIVGGDRVAKGTVNDLCVRYYLSAEFKNLRPATQKNYRRQIESFRQAVGDIPVTAIKRSHFQGVKDAMVDRPGACMTLLKRLHTLFAFALDREMIVVNPASRLKMPKQGAGFVPWTDDDIAMYFNHWPKGSRERLGVYLLLFLGQRRSDIVKMGWQHVKDNLINVVQQKGGKRLWISMHPILMAELELHPKNQMMFLVNPRNGKPLSGEGFSNWIRHSAKIAGIEDSRAPHGLRKAASRRLIEAGCDSETARAITGHASDRELKPYIQDVDQLKLAKRAISMLNQNKA